MPLRALTIAVTLLLSLPACKKSPPQRHASKTTSAQTKTTSGRIDPKDESSKKPIEIDPAARPTGWSTGPMSSLSTFTQKLAKSASEALIAKKDAKKAFAPFVPKIQDSLSEQLAKASARRIELLGMELELVFVLEGKVSYYLRTFVHPAKSGPEFFKIDGREPPQGKLNVPHWAIGEVTKTAPELAKAAEGLAGVLNDGRCKLLPIVRPETLEGKIKPGPMKLSMLSNLRKAAMLRAKTCATLPKLAAATPNMRVDDFTFIVFGEKDALLGTLHGEMTLDGNDLVVELKGLRLF